MDYADLRFARELQDRLLKIIEEEAGQLSSGYAADFNDYKLRVGRIEAHRTTLALIEEISQTVTGRVTERPPNG